MGKKMILTAVGRDQPGIVAAVSKVLFETGSNIEDSSMTQLGGDFAMMLLVALKAGVGSGEVRKKLSTLEKDFGLIFSLREIDKEVSAKPPQPTYMLSVYGADHPGIVYGVADLLARKKVNITDVSTRVIGEEGTPIYCMLLELELAAGMEAAALEKELAARARELKVDLSFRPVEHVEL